jgi:hypothetical protein
VLVRPFAPIARPPPRELSVGEIPAERFTDLGIAVLLNTEVDAVSLFLSNVQAVAVSSWPPS